MHSYVFGIAQINTKKDNIKVKIVYLFLFLFLIHSQGGVSLE